MRAATAFVPIVIFLCPAATLNNTRTMSAPSASSTAIAQSQALTINPVHHAAIELEWNRLVILVDPAAGSERFKSFPPPDLILITDIHGDHLDTITLRGLDLGKARIIAPQAVMDLLPQDLKKITVPLANGASTEALGIGIEAVPMYNMPDPHDPRHPKGRGNGYVITLGGERIYISGDTEDIPEMRALRNIDVAFVCMNLPYTMTIYQAASAVLAFKPHIVYPYHYRGKDGLSDVGHFKELVADSNSAIEVRLVDWYKE